MRSRAAVVAAVATLVGAGIVLLLPDGEQRVWWFRAYVLVVGIFATRALVVWVETQPRPTEPAPFRRRRRWGHRAAPAPTKPTARLVQLAMFSAGDAHRGLRPVLQLIADERLRAHHGIGLDDPGAATRLAPTTWELVRPDRPRPHDLRVAGLTPEAIDALLDDLERL